jgi:hypothetical protein
MRSVEDEPSDFMPDGGLALTDRDWQLAWLEKAKDGDYDAVIEIRRQKPYVPEVIAYFKDYRHPNHRPRSYKAKLKGFASNPNRMALALAKGMARNVPRPEAIKQAVEMVNRSFEEGGSKKRARADYVERNMYLSWNRAKPPWSPQLNDDTPEPPHLNDDDNEN